MPPRMSTATSAAVPRLAAAVAFGIAAGTGSYALLYAKGASYQIAVLDRTFRPAVAP